MEMTTFQKVVLGVFFVSMIIGVAFFAIQRTSGVGNGTEVTMWGTLDNDLVTSLNDALRDADYDVSITYRYIPEERLVEAVLEALAAGTGPDIVMFPSERFIELEDKFQRIPLDAYSEREFRDTFVEAGEVFVDYDGIVALPFMIDPLVTYWNRDLYSNASLSRPPLHWDEVPAMIPLLTKSDGTQTITQSAFALGEYENVTHAKEILQSLLLQAGNPIISRVAANTNRPATFDAVLTRRFDRALDPSTAALSFYTQFADPSRDTYTWNRSLRDSNDAFAVGELATYFGYASEMQTIQRLNPNLNYDVAPFPQTRAASAMRSFARVWGLAIPKNSKNADGAFYAILGLTSEPSITRLLQGSVLPPVRRDMLANIPSNSWGKVFYNSAFTSRGVYDIKPTDSDAVYRSMIESVTSGRLGTDGSVARAEVELNQYISDKINVWEE